MPPEPAKTATSEHGRHLSLMPVVAHHVKAYTRHKNVEHFRVDLKTGWPPLEAFWNVVRRDNFVGSQWHVKVLVRGCSTEDWCVLTAGALTPAKLSAVVGGLSALQFSVEVDDQRTNSRVRVHLSAHPGMVFIYERKQRV